MSQIAGQAKRVSRRFFLKGLALAGGGAVLAACQPQVVEKTVVVKETVEVEVVEEVEVEVEKTVEVEKVVEVTAVPAGEVREISLQLGRYTPSKYIGADLQEGAPEYTVFDTLANEYMADHPDLVINFVARPAAANWREYIVTNLVAGTAPEILNCPAYWANEDVNKGWWLPWDPYLEEPNPYVDAGETGSQKWHDQFSPSIDFFQNPDGNIYILLADDTQVGFYYNKDMFAELGLDEPATWAEMIANATAAEEELGVPGFAWPGAGEQLLHNLTWTSGWIARWFFYEQIKEWDTDGNGWPDQFETAEAIAAGTYSARMPTQVGRLRTLRDMATHWQEGFTGCDRECSYRLFLTGQALTTQTGIWNLQNFLDDPDRDFELGWHYFVPLTKETHELVQEESPMNNLAAGYGSFMYGLTETARWNDTAEDVADFMKYCTTPERAGMIINEVAGTVPNIEGAPLHPLHAQFPTIGESVRYPPPILQEDDALMDAEYGDRFAETVVLYISDQMSEEDMLDDLQVYMEEASARMLAIKAAQGL
jgi:raffinose/stachyose/melibiose transport system substrate-binding protein